MNGGMWERGDEHTQVPGGTVTIAAPRGFDERAHFEDLGITLPPDVVARAERGATALLTLRELDDECMWVVLVWGARLDVFAGDPNDFGNGSHAYGLRTRATVADLTSGLTPHRVAALWLAAGPQVFNAFIDATASGDMSLSTLTAFEQAMTTGEAP